MIWKIVLLPNLDKVLIFISAIIVECILLACLVRMMDKRKERKERESKKFFKDGS